MRRGAIVDVECVDGVGQDVGNIRGVGREVSEVGNGVGEVIRRRIHIGGFDASRIWIVCVGG